VLACRPATLTAALAPVAVGTACAAAAGGVRMGPALAALAGALLIQIGTNLANDVFDAEKGADTSERRGPVRAVQAGLLEARAVRAGMIVAFALATACGGYLAWTAGWAVVAIGVASVASGIAYTGGPWPLGYHGLGDLFVMIFFGFVAVCGTTFVQRGGVPAIAWWASLPIGALATAVLVVNNARDRATDVKAGKRTLAVRLGRRAAIVEYAALILVAGATPIAMAVTHVVSAWVLVACATLPVGALLIVRFARASEDDGATHNALLGATARLLLLEGALLAVGIVA
jgi:1,4-dihydroxy-2-naphthoate octaprenyltransferase